MSFVWVVRSGGSSVEVVGACSSMLEWGVVGRRNCLGVVGGLDEKGDEEDGSRGMRCRSGILGSTCRRGLLVLITRVDQGNKCKPARD
jgi:hypothetical protein